MRITEKHIDHLVKTINELTNSPIDYAIKQGDKYLIQVGHYHLDSAYGGHKLVRTMNDKGGIREITHGYDSKRELYGKLQAFIRGLETSKE